MEDPREALLRMGNATSVPDTPYDIVPAQPQKSKRSAKSSRIVELQDSTELPGQTSDALVAAIQDDGEDEEEAAEAKKARKAAKKARKAAKRAEAEAATAAMDVIPESQLVEEQNIELHDANLEGMQNIESLLREHQQQQEQQQREQQDDVDGEAALAVQVLASSALQGRVGTDAEQQNSIAPGARIAMMGFPDHLNIDPMLRGPDDTDEDLQNRIQALHAWQAAQQPDREQQQQQITEGVFAQGAPQVPIMGLQGGFGIFDASQHNGNIADLAAAAEQQMTADMVQAEPKSKGKGGRKRKADDETAEGGETTKKRKRRASQDDDEGGIAETGTTKKKGKKVKTTEGEEEEEDISDSNLPSTGPFHKSEIARIEKIVSLFRDNNNMEQKEINDLVQNKSREKSEQRDMFWNDLYASLPNRQHVAIQRTTRRRYHNYTERGVWNKDADERLKQAYATHPQKWVAIGEKLNRMPEDCRDRWRNYLACGDAKRTEDWTQKEEMALQFVVGDLAKAIRRDAFANAKKKGHAFNSAQDWESMVNFNTVSENMHRKRSRLQCYQHWRIMQARNEREAEGTGRRAAAAMQAADENAGTTASGAPKNEWRRRQAVDNYSKMTLDDKIKIAHAVAGSETLEEAMIPWRLLKKQDQASNWSTMDRKVAFQSIKKYVPRHNTLAETCTAIINYLDEWKRTGEQPTVAESVGEEEQGLGVDGLNGVMLGGEGAEGGVDGHNGRNSAKKPGPGHGPRDTNGKWKRKNKLSADMVVESDDEDDDDGEQDEQNAEEQDADQDMADGEESVYRSALSGPHEQDLDSVTGEEVAKQLHQEEMMAMPYAQAGPAVEAMM